MIYLDHSNARQTVRIPLGITMPGAAATELRLLKTGGGRAAQVVTIDTAAYNGQYLTGGVTLPKMTAGEYEYTLMQGSDIVAQGLAVIGHYRAAIKQYDKTNEIIEYGA